MARRETCIQKIVHFTAKRFSSFGNGDLFDVNPISRMLKGKPPVFAAGVDIEQVVRFVLAKRNALVNKQRQKIGNDARDISMTSGLLKPLSSEALGSLQHLKQREVRQQLRDNSYPFSRLNKKTRETLLHLPISWVREGAQWQLNSRKPAILLLHR